jgi:hypothetical protein
MVTANAKENASRRKTLYFDDVTARMLAERAKQEHRSESNYLQYLIIQDTRAQQAAVPFFGQIEHQGKQ